MILAKILISCYIVIGLFKLEYRYRSQRDRIGQALITFSVSVDLSVELLKSEYLVGSIFKKMSSLQATSAVKKSCDLYVSCVNETLLYATQKGTGLEVLYIYLSAFIIKCLNKSG